MTQITANDLKTRGIAAIEASLAGGRTEAMVSVRGAGRFVVMELAQYQHLLECELEAALAESRADIPNVGSYQFAGISDDGLRLAFIAQPTRSCSGYDCTAAGPARGSP